MNEFSTFLVENLTQFWHLTGFYNATWEHLVMLLVGLFFIWLAITKNFEPMLLVPIGFGILIGNVPFNATAGLEIGIYEEGSVLNILYNGVSAGWYPPLIFLGIGAMTDFTALIANPKLMLVGAAAQFGIFGAYMVALALGFMPDQAGAIAIIGGADGPTAIFLSSKLAPNLLGAIAVSAYSYMALVPVIQPPIMRLLTTRHERLTILLGMTVGASTQASSFLTKETIFIFALGFMAFIIASASGVLFVKLFNLVLPASKKINPLIGNAGVSAVPMSARISNNLGLEYDPSNYLLMHAMGPNVAGVIGSAVAAGVLLGFLAA